MCDSEIADDNRAMKQAALEATVSKLGGWGYLESRTAGYTFNVGSWLANVEAVKDTPGYPTNDYDGAYNQGETFEAFIIVAIDGTYFKKTGTGDSYGEISWDGLLKVVVPTTKMVKVFE
jgi:hypothetical protein